MDRPSSQNTTRRAPMHSIGRPLIPARSDAGPLAREFDLALDLHGNIERQLGEPDCAAAVRPNKPRERILFSTVGIIPPTSFLAAWFAAHRLDGHAALVCRDDFALHRLAALGRLTPLDGFAAFGR